MSSSFAIRNLVIISSLFFVGCSDNSTSTTPLTTQVRDDHMGFEYKTGQGDADHLYLEEVLGARALDEVKGWNKRTLSRLTSDPRFETLYAQALEILQSEDKIPYVSYRAGRAHNFWQDETHLRGLWRQTTLESYLSSSPKWETVLDFDALAAKEDKNWVYKGNVCLGPDYRRCIVNLSDGGKDAVVRREFDVKDRRWVEDGFITEESKGTLDWVDKDRVIIGVDFGADEAGQSSMTSSGYPMVAKIWTRGTPLSLAIEIGRGQPSDVGYWGGVLEMSSGAREIIVSRSRTFYDTDYIWFPQKDGGAIGAGVPIPVPEKSSLGSEFKGQALLSLAQDWRGFVSGDLVSFSWEDFAKTGQIETLNLVFHPDEKSSLGGYGVTKSKVLLSVLRDVSGSALSFDWDGQNWIHQKLDFPENGAVSIGATNGHEDLAFISSESFLTPDTLWAYDTAAEKKSTAKSTAKSKAKSKAKSMPDWFDAGSMTSEQFFATSSDGTKVPYFVVRGKDIKLDGTNPTLLYGYGGFEVSLNPSYSATRGKLWLERGGVYVLANIRGGGEYGPNWHQAGLKTKRQTIYDDFISVAEDLIVKGITTPQHLGIEGGSNGGLLTGVMYTQRPELFQAVIVAVPLLDMVRFHKLLAGASWMGEYGDPDDAIEGAFLRSISPYHNIDPQGDYPEVFFITSTKDDRVHPAHARKAAKRMQDHGHEFLYYENIDGGHSAAANLKETAKRLALQHVYLLQKLKDGS